MAKFRNADEFFDDTLTLPAGGKEYTIPAPDAELGLWCQRLMSAAWSIQTGGQPEDIPPLPALPDEEDQTPITATAKAEVPADQRLYRRVLGPVWDQLKADAVSWPKIQLIAQTAVFWIGSGLEMAEQFWNSGGDPEALAPSRRQRRSTATAGANTTRSRSSGTSTRSRKTSGKR